MLVIACQQQVGLEQPVNEFDKSQDVIIQGLQLAPEGSCLLLGYSAFGIHSGGLHRRFPTATGPPDFPAIHSVSADVILVRPALLPAHIYWPS